MPTATLNQIDTHYRDEGDPNGAPVLFINSLGTTLHLWDPILAHLPDGLRILRYDMRGHGESEVPPAPYSMGTLVKDAEALLEHLNVTDALVVGLSIGGMVAQGLAVKRLDLVRAMVLSNTAAKIGSPKMWEERIDAVRTKGLPAMSDDIMLRWFSRDFQTRPELSHWKAMLEATPPEGYAGCCAAIQGTDFYTPTSGLRLPTLGIAGSEDGATPPDLVRETVELIPGARLELLRRTGHLPCVEKPEAYAALLTDFMKETGHV
ncbi:3-oxoadipate enol-lactonase [Shimia sagamensis]|uniref:3-oxoadipate enol-lactonase n=1 Tax=Shimia sagamensis TaxID=1566352 RepID=A0ABY1PG75_9RHOB|nr:3-oxoadipate enol-lactonase [Shimia sagamensis]SMP33150.1 3-oxoadipate enol-lactonase [Shimia sagamensis]